MERFAEEERKQKIEEKRKKTIENKKLKKEMIKKLVEECGGNQNTPINDDLVQKIETIFKSK
jgi:TRAP-type C4-dicarboxylate transport system substrate-binding protein